MLVENLIARAKIVKAVRAFFDERDFTEVSTPVRIAAPAPEPHIDCPLAPMPSTFNPQPSTLYLRASPELQMKKLLAYGMDRIYQLGPCFREGERGARHHPEFTMLEWYRRTATYLDILADMRDLLRSLCRIADCDAPCEFATITVRDAYRRLAGWDPWTDWDQDRFDFDMAVKIEPNLPPTPTFLIDYPPQACSLAKLRGDVAERWEFYWHGIELANCFTELCDGAEQRRRFMAARDERRALGEADYPIDDEFLDLLPLIGSAAGVALGVDRLVMLLCREKTISAVMAC